MSILYFNSEESIRIVTVRSGIYGSSSLFFYRCYAPFPKGKNYLGVEMLEKVKFLYLMWCLWCHRVLRTWFRLLLICCLTESTMHISAQTTEVILNPIQQTSCPAKPLVLCLLPQFKPGMLGSPFSHIMSSKLRN